MELWTQNHFTLLGDPCDRCPACLTSHKVLTTVQQFQNQAREYQKWQNQFKGEGKQVALEIAKREKDNTQARAPIKQELEKEDWSRIQEAAVLQKTYSEKKATCQRTYEEEYSEIKHKLNQGTEAAKIQFNEELAALNLRY
jgi:hypothetical protein